MHSDIEKYDWTEWRKFPDPRKGELLCAPYGMGLYQIRNSESGEFIMFGIGKNCALRMTSILPEPLGQGRRNNTAKREYVLKYLRSIEYRTMSFNDSEKEMKLVEKEIKSMRIHKFNT